MAALLAMVGLGAQRALGTGRAARIAIAAVLIVVAGTWIGGDVFWGTVTRLAAEVEKPEEGVRLRLWSDAVDLGGVAPATGTGLGTFGVAYPLVRTIRMPVVFTHAESDWIQLFMDTGMAGLALVLVGGALLAVHLFREFRRSRSQWSRALALAGLVALIGVAVQGMGNFNLIVMSNLVFVATALVLAAKGQA
jgi:hypothetical protein